MRSAGRLNRRFMSDGRPLAGSDGTSAGIKPSCRIAIVRCCCFFLRLLLYLLFYFLCFWPVFGKTSLKQTIILLSVLLLLLHFPSVRFWCVFRKTCQKHILEVGRFTHVADKFFARILRPSVVQVLLTSAKLTSSLPVLRIS